LPNPGTATSTGLWYLAVMVVLHTDLWPWKQDQI